MSYRVHFSDGSDYITIPDKEIDISTDLALIGKNVYDYGQPIATNFVHLLENFANTGTGSVNAPSNPIAGQLYYNKDEENYYYHNGTEWNDFKLSTIAPLTLLDSDGSTEHVVSALLDEDTLVGVISSEEFDIHSSDANYALFDENLAAGSHIRAGITLKEGLMFHGTATSAQYADLAEMYESDAPYEAGTVLKIGGEAIVTQTTDAFCPDVFGIVSTDPAYLMNSSVKGCAVPVALEGRVPCKVIGPVKKGQRLVASEQPGVARAASDYELQESMDWYRQVGRALENKTTEGIELIEVVVGAK